MRLFTNLLIVFFSTSAWANIDCTAQLREGAQLSEVKTKESYENKDVKKWNANIGDMHYSVTHYKGVNDYMLIISKGPDYMNGRISRGGFESYGASATGVTQANGKGNFNSYGRISLGWVAKSNTATLVCYKK